MKVIEPNLPAASDFFTSIWKTQTWVNIVYLLLSFPLGLFYFIILATGISLGFGLLITILGIFILMGVMILVHWFTRFEVMLTNNLLGFQIRPNLPEPTANGFWGKLKEKMRSPFTWKGLLFLFLRFPMGIFAFCLTVSLLAVSLGMISLPLLYHFSWLDIDWPANSFWIIDSYLKTFVVAIVGVLLLYASLFVFNILAWIYGNITKILLGE